MELWISIHTLTWRVTTRRELSNYVWDISIHTLTWRVTKYKITHIDKKSDFNPHPHVEGDGNSGAGVSGVCNFNPHPHVEGDLIFSLINIFSSYFNPHPHVEGDQTIVCSIAARNGFQSTPSRGG